MGDTVTVVTAKWHTLNNQAYDVGDDYEAPADLVDSLATQGMAVAKPKKDPGPPQSAPPESTPDSEKEQ